MVKTAIAFPDEEPKKETNNTIRRVGIVSGLDTRNKLSGQVMAFIAICDKNNNK